jgi:hypothetical protein
MAAAELAEWTKGYAERRHELRPPGAQAP